MEALFLDLELLIFSSYSIFFFSFTKKSLGFRATGG